MIGSSATFNVSGLVLTTADPVVDISGNFMPTFDTFSLSGAAGGTSAITIQPGAQINVSGSSQSNYMVAIAPQISQGGTINVAGSTALVAAESADFAIDSSGLFNISVTAGSTISSNTFVHTGTTGSTDSVADAAPQLRRVYMVAVPKNNAITMAISSGGSIGFDIAGAAAQQGNAIVLSAGSNIADTGSGNPIITGQAGIGTPALTIGAGNYTSNTVAASTGSATVTDPAASISFAANLSIAAPQATVHAAAGTIQVGGDLKLDADSMAGVAAGTALVQADTGAAIKVGTAPAALGFTGSLFESANDLLGGHGGTAQLYANGGAITIAGQAQVSAIGAWNGSGAINPGGIATQGGNALVNALGGGGITIGSDLSIDASADASAAAGAYVVAGPMPPDIGIDAAGGSATLVAAGTASQIAASNIFVNARALGGTDTNIATGGTATGGQAQVSASSGGLISASGNVAIVASASATSGDGGFGDGGLAMGGSATIIANAATIETIGKEGVSAIATASGGSSSSSGGNGGGAVGGSALIETQGANGQILTNTSGSTGGVDAANSAVADATGGAATSSGSGGAATGGTATIAETGSGQAIRFDRSNGVLISATTTGGTGFGSGGGVATGGNAQLLVDGGAFAVTNTGFTINSSAFGGNDNGDSFGGDGVGGTSTVRLTSGGSVSIDSGSVLAASASGGTSGAAGNAYGGNILVSDSPGGTYNFDVNLAGIVVDASATAGTGSLAGTIGSAGGARFQTVGSFDIAQAITLAGNSSLSMQAAGNITVEPTAAISGTGGGAHLQLYADTGGTGTGTVTLGSGVINLSGIGATVDIDYNPAALGTPTDYAPGVAAGLLTGYQLVNDVNKLQLVGSFTSQNFALGRNIDASQTQGWNGGSGFVPIGNAVTPFTGNFDGLGHAVTGLFINRPTSSGIGLFGLVGAGTGASIRIAGIGLIDPQVGGQDTVGALIGSINADTVTVSQSTVTGGSVTGYAGTVGGLIGKTSISGNVVLHDLHSDTSVTATQNGFVGGLIGYDGASTIDRVFATGPVNSTAAGVGLIGGLIGYMHSGTLTRAYASGAVTAASGSAEVGGLVGEFDSGTIRQAYAVGNVTVGAGSSYVGGLVGFNDGAIDESWASGAVSGTGTGFGGLVGWNRLGSISNSYWDTYSTGQSGAFGLNTGSVTAIGPVTSDPLCDCSNYALNPGAYGFFPAADWIYQSNATRPIGNWEIPVAQYGTAPVFSAHQIQLIDRNLAGSYTVTQNIDMTGTSRLADVWGGLGLIPIGSTGPFSGKLSGAGHVISNLLIGNNAALGIVGMISQNAGEISDIGLWNMAIGGTNNYAGALVGQNDGTISDSFATGSITGSDTLAGGLVGLNNGAIVDAYADVALNTFQTSGGLVGRNEGSLTRVFARGSVGGSPSGGLVGNNDSASVGVSYWDTQLSGQAGACGVGSSVACTASVGLTTAQTMQSASFVGFPIDNLGGQGLTWRIYESQTTPLLSAFLRPITVQPASLNTQYNATTPNPGVFTYDADPALLFGTPTLSGLSPNAGNHTINYTGGLYSNQIGYDLVGSTTPGSLVITPAPLTLGAVTDSRTYNATTGSAGLVQVLGLQGSDSVAGLTQAFDSANAGARTLAVNAGYTVNDGNSGGNYAVTVQGATGTISTAGLTLRAVTDSRTYNATTGSAGLVQVLGLQGSDSVTGLAQSFDSANAGARTLAVNAGYTVNDGNSGGNYAVTLQAATGTISAAGLIVTYTANAATNFYGSAIPALGGSVGAAGLQGSDTLASVTSGGGLASTAPPAALHRSAATRSMAAASPAHRATTPSRSRKAPAMPPR